VIRVIRDTADTSVTATVTVTAVAEAVASEERRRECVTRITVPFSVTVYDRQILKDDRLV